MSTRNEDNIKIATAGILVLGLLFSLVASAVWTWGPATVRQDCTVTNLDTQVKRSSEGNRGDLKLAYTENCGVLAVDDNLFRGYLDSGDVYGQLQEGQTYDVTTIGWRWHIPTLYPNIIEVNR